MRRSDSYPAVVVATLVVLAPDAWQAERAAHESRADRLARDHVARRRQGERHPVEDFLWTYYLLRPGTLRRWHAGVGRGRLGVGKPEPGETIVDAPQGPVATVDVAAWRTGREATLAAVTRLLAAVAGRAPRHDCFGLHEWAMLYRPGADERPRHDLPLRLDAAATTDVVDKLPLRCSHYDAFRFFTREARPRNAARLTRADQPLTDQPGCVHVTMDLLKWCLKLGPLVPGGLLLDSFDLARDARTLDMRAGPYDLTPLGHPPIAVETPAGRAAYATAQRELTARAAPLREQLLTVCRAAARTSPVRRSGEERVEPGRGGSAVG